jgi:O-antigen/teichoic acid export membrane protein
MSSVRRSLAYTFAESYLANALQIVSIFFLARWLTPAETGVWAIAAVFAAIASNFRDFGVAEYLIQEKTLTDEKLRAAFAVNIAASWLMAVCLLLASGAIAEFYREPGVASVMRVQACNFFLIPFGAVTYAYFRRNLDYRPFFLASALANVVTFVVALTCAWKGLGYMSLAWASLAGVFTTVAFAIAVRPKELPRLPGFRGWRGVLHAGKHLTGIYLFGQIGKSAPELIIGRTLGVAPVGFFSRANGLGELFNRTIMRAALPVCLPYFAQEIRKGEDVRDGYLRAVAYLTVIGWPAFFFLTASAFPTIRILYGTQWIESVPLAQILCVAAAIEVTYFLAKEVLIAQGDARSANYLQVVSQIARIIGLLAAIPFGLPGACWGLLAAAVVGGYLSHRMLFAGIGLTLSQLLRTCRISFIVTLICTAPAFLWAGLGTVGEHNYLVVMVLTGGAFCVLWLASLRFFHHPLWREMHNFLLRLRRSRSA